MAERVTRVPIDHASKIVAPGHWTSRPIPRTLLEDEVAPWPHDGSASPAAKGS